MRFLPLVGLYQKNTAASLASGVYWNTAPTDCPPLGSLAVEDGNIFELARISGTCTVGSLLYLTGTQPYGGGNTSANLVVSGTTVKPVGISLIAPTTSGAWTWVQVYGKCTTIQVTSTFGVGSASAAMYGGGGSAAVNLSYALTSLIGLNYIGQCLTDAVTGSTTVGYINLL